MHILVSEASNPMRAAGLEHLVTCSSQKRNKSTEDPFYKEGYLLVHEKKQYTQESCTSRPISHALISQQVTYNILF